MKNNIPNRWKNTCAPRITLEIVKERTHFPESLLRGLSGARVSKYFTSRQAFQRVFTVYLQESASIQSRTSLSQCGEAVQLVYSFASLLLMRACFDSWIDTFAIVSQVEGSKLRPRRATRFSDHHPKRCLIQRHKWTFSAMRREYKIISSHPKPKDTITKSTRFVRRVQDYLISS